MHIKDNIEQLNPAIADLVTDATPGFRFATGEGELSARQAIPPMSAQWIWSGDDAGYDDYREARHEFTLTDDQLTQVRRGGRIELSITADALYQVWINGRMLGHGPAKSAKGTRGIDTYDLARQAVPGVNRLDVLALNLGAGNMCYCMGKPGLLFEVRLDDDLLAASGPETLMRPSRSRDKPTVRRWMLPCIEDVDAGAAAGEWAPASVVERDLALYPRRVPLPTREPLTMRRIVAADRVKLPTFAISFRHKPYLVSPEELPRNNNFGTPAYLVTDIVSPVAQPLRFTPTRGAFDWYFKGRKLVAGNGWGPWEETDEAVTIDLIAGANRLVGVHKHDHFADISLAGFCETPVEFTNPFGPGGFQIVPVDEPIADSAPDAIDWEALCSAMPPMDPAHTMPAANAQDLALGAEVTDSTPDLETLLRTPAGAPLVLPAAPDGEAVRVVVDLGMVHNGWLAFEANGRAGNRLLFSFFEGIDAGPPLRLHWAYGAENALTYRLTDGPQRFESFHPYGVRYIAIHHTGAEPVSLSNLRVLTANCGSRPKGFLRCSDPLLNEIYAIATQTVISSVDDTFTDCPTFEQVNWNYDNRAAFLGEILTCANTAVARHSIALFAEDPEFAGLVRSQYPSTWDNFIPLWSMHWIMWCRDYVELTGDLAFGRQMYPRIRAGIEEALGKIGDRGLLEWDGVWHFVEWGHGRDDGHAICGVEQAGLAGALEAAVRIANLLGETDATAWNEARTALVNAINRELWDESRGAYADSLHADGTLSPVSSQTTNAMMGIYGVADNARAEALAQRIVDNDPALLAYGSPYGLYYVLELFDRFEMVEPIFAAIRHRWGDMVLDGDRTTWETFAEYGGHGGFPTRSRCHPFAAYVVRYLVKYLLGVSSWNCGESPVAGKPNPPSGVTFCRGAVPTPQGLLPVGWDARNSALR
jgi:alpha-L-rhamnosidase